MKKDETVYIRHIYDCIRRIEEYVSDGREAFFRDHKTQDAVIRNLEIIGQAVKDIQVDKLVVTRNEIPWSRIAGLRNVLARQYLGVDLELVWKNVENDLPALKSAIKEIAIARDVSLDQPND